MKYEIAAYTPSDSACSWRGVLKIIGNEIETHQNYMDGILPHVGDIWDIQNPAMTAAALLPNIPAGGVGGVIGALVGPVVMASRAYENSGTENSSQNGLGPVGAVFAGTVGGFFAGGVIGALEGEHYAGQAEATVAGTIIGHEKANLNCVSATLGLTPTPQKNLMMAPH